MNLLLLSSSRANDGPWLTWAFPEIRASLGPARSIAFIPWAGVTLDWSDYARMFAEAMAPLNVIVRSVHESDDPCGVIRECDALAVGGGNTFRLVERMHATRVMDTIRERVRGGAPYLGWSAGSNVACPTIRTTNDMPVIEPESFGALGLIPFQLNAHYSDFAPPGFHGETRAQRLAEFTALNPAVPVLAMREGAMLVVRDDAMHLAGEADAVLFRAGAEPQPIGRGAVSIARSEATRDHASR
ncbi:MAG: dipeptidase PepE [Gemmatimonadaceae bacterium]